MLSNESKLGEREATALFVTGITAKIFLDYPAAVITDGGSAGWMVALLSGLTAVFGFFIIFKLLERISNKNFAEIVADTAGPFLGLLIMLIVILPYGASMGLTIRRLADLTIGVALFETPVEAIMFILIIVSGLAVFTGINVIARACYLAFPFSLFGVVTICLLTYPLWEINWLFPLLGNGPEQILTKGIIHVADFSEISFIYLIPLLFFPKQIKKVGYKSIGLSTVIFLGIVVTYNLCYPAVVAQEPYVPAYIMARSVYMTRFFQRIEIIFVIFWVVAGYLWISTGYYGFCQLLANFLKLPDYRPLVIPTGVVFYTVALIPESAPQATFINRQFTGISLVTVFGIPALLLFLAWVRKKGGKAGA